MLPQAGRAGLYLSVWVRAVVTEHQVGPPAVEQQVRGLEGQGEALGALAEVKGVPQVVVGGVDKKVLKNKRKHKTRLNFFWVQFKGLVQTETWCCF